MNNKVIIVIVIVVVLVFAGVFYYTTRDTSVQNDDDANQELPGDEDLNQTVTAEHQFSDGVHTVVGEINLPTPCHVLDHEVEIRESFPEQVTISFTSESTAEVCAQVVTPAEFSVQFEASENARIDATLDGEPLNLSLRRVAPGQNVENGIDDSTEEVFIKG